MHRLALLPLALLIGCATAAKFEVKMNGFVGGPESAIVERYGPPNSAYALADGSRVIQYTRGSTAAIPMAPTTVPVTTNTAGTLTVNRGLQQSTGNYNQQSTTYVQQQAAPIIVSLSCTVRFTVDAGGTVRRWSAEGNHCVAD